MPELVSLASSVTGGVLSWFAESSVVACLLAALALLGGRLRRPRLGPATRHILWLMVLIRLVAPPLVHWPWSVSSAVLQSRQESIRPTDRPERTRAVAPGVDSGAGPADVRRSGVVSESVVSAIERPAAELLRVLEGGRREAPSRVGSTDESFSLRGLGAAIVLTWLAGSIVLAFRLARQLLRFRGLLVDARPAPDWLIEVAARVGGRMTVRVPEIRVVGRLETPLIWCLGRPVMLIPEGLIKSLESGRWRAILAHELAHLRRRDHWVRRLELAAGLIWWWNPLYWLALRNLDHEAELACDAWVLWESPGDRITYAESLIRICSALPTTVISVPSLGIAGSGLSFERRLTMILSERVDRRTSLSSLLAALVLAALSLPSWTAADAAGAKRESLDLPGTSAAADPAPDPNIHHESSGAAVEPADDEDEPASKAKADARKQAEQDLLKKKEALDLELQRKFGPDSEFAKKMETLGREMEKKFGPGSEFVKKMQELGEEMGEKFGPDSEFVKEIRLNFGPDSDLAKELVKALGPDSEFLKEMKKLGLRIDVIADANVKDTGEEAGKAKLKAEEKAKDEAKKATTLARKARVMALDQARKAKAEPKKSKEKAEAARAVVKPDAEARKREGRIDALQARIEAMQDELNRLKAELKDKDDDEEG